MRKFRIAVSLLAAVLIAGTAAGCSNQTPTANPSDSGSVAADSVPAENNSPAETNKSNSETEAEEIPVALNQEAEKNETVFKVNSVIDAGVQGTENKKYIYLNVTIKNTSGTDYSLNTLNNFYLLLPDGTESHFDIRTQLYAQNNFREYQNNPIIVPANGEFTGYIGGYPVESSVDSFTICFYPTQNDERNKSSVIKCPVAGVDIIQPPADLIS